MVLWSSNLSVVRFWFQLKKEKEKGPLLIERVAWVGTIGREWVDDGRKSWNLPTKRRKGTNRRGEGSEEPAMWPQIWATTRRERKRKAKANMGRRKESYLSLPCDHGLHRSDALIWHQKQQQLRQQEQQQHIQFLRSTWYRLGWRRLAKTLTVKHAVPYPIGLENQGQ